MTRSTMHLRSGSSQLDGVTDAAATVPAKHNHDPLVHRGKRGTMKSLDESRHAKRQKIDEPPLPSPKPILRSRQPKQIDRIRRHERVPVPVIQAPRPTRSTRISSNSHDNPIKISEDPAEQTATFIPPLQFSTRNERRTLRSQDHGSRPKGELSQFFQNYDQMISLEPVKQEFLIETTQVTLIDDLAFASEASSSKQHPKSPQKPPTTERPQVPPSAAHFPPPDLLTNLFQAQRIKLPSLDKAPRNKVKDPLSDEKFYKAHRRAERQEKQLRNIEKEKAQHEKVQLDRILDDLKGPDWLKTMGISGVTDSEKRRYEPKRRLFIREVTALLDKFRTWKEEDKRRKQEKDLATASNGVETESKPAASTPSPQSDPLPNGAPSNDTAKPSADEDPPDVNDIDAWAARQLQQEAQASKRPKAPALLPPSPPEKPFHSFFAKPYLRDAAIGNARRGRNRAAFGHPIPELEEREFALPPEYLSAEAIRASMRKRRRLRRESKDVGAGV